MIKVKDTWLRIALVTLPNTKFFYGLLVEGEAISAADIIYILTVILVCEGSRLLVYRSFSWFSAPYRKSKRLLALLPFGTMWVAILFIISKALRNFLAYGNLRLYSNEGFTLQFEANQVKLALIGASIFNAAFAFLLLWGVFEVAYQLAKLRHTEQQRDRLEKEKLQAELQQLKGIVNPHFLFNNLNSLSSLISESPAQAEAFLDELTKVFRYLLRNNDTVLTTLAQELAFMDSYYHLLQTRYGKAIQLRVDVDAESAACLLPPLTLQLLVENAVKHNRVHKTEPLYIDVFLDGKHQLVVRNNILLRDQQAESTGIGLNSIHGRYRLLNQETPIISKDAHFFSVSIALIPAAEALAPEQAEAKRLPSLNTTKTPVAANGLFKRIW